MNRVCSGVLIALLFAANAAYAQQGVAYGVGGFGAYSAWFGSGSLYSISGGGEFVRKVVGVGGEYGLMGNAGSVLGVLSVNGVAYLLPMSGRATPFLTAGYSRFSSGDGAFNAWNAGAGVNVWGNEHIGGRLEFRDHVRPDSRGRVHYLTFRAGIAVR